MGASLKFNKLQRAALVVAAAVIGIILWVQIDSSGLDDTPWLWGILIILALLLLASRGESAGTVMPTIQSPMPKPAIEDLRPEFLEVVGRVEDFIRAKLATLPHDLPVQFLGETGGYIDGVALRGAFALTLLRREQRHKGYIESDAVMELRKLAVGHLANSKMQDLRRAVDGPPKRSDLLKQAADETVRYEIAVRQALQKKALAEPLALDAVFALLDRELPLSDGDAEDRLRVYGPIADSILSA